MIITGSYFKTAKSNSLLIAIFLFAIILRVSYFNSSPFGFDQIQIAENASAITKGDVTLIGPRTGPADMFTGPLIYYVNAPFALFLNPAYATIFATAFISLITGVTIYFLTKKYLSTYYSFTVLILWGFSPLLIHFDRIPWNPNLTLIASALTFFPLLKKQRLNFIDSSLLSLGVLLGYQAHFSGILLPFFVSVALILRKEFKLIIFPVIGFIFTIIPTILFDYRNNWLNYQGLLKLLSNKEAVSSYLIGLRILEKFYIIIETLGKVIFQGNSPSLYVCSGIYIVSAYTYINSKKKELSAGNFTFTAPFLFIILTASIFSLYRNSTPEYYFFILLPCILYIWATVLIYVQINNKHLFFVLLLQAALFVHSNYSKPQNLTIGYQYAVAQKIAQLSYITPISHIEYDIKPVDQLGLQYFVKQNPPQLNSEGVSVHVTTPLANLHNNSYDIGIFSIWLDPRKTKNYSYLETPEFFIGIPENWKIAEQVIPPPNGNNELRYLLTVPYKESYPLTIVNNLPDHGSPTKDRIEDQVLEPIRLKSSDTQYWHAGKYQGNQGYYFESGSSQLFISLISKDELSLIEVHPR